MSRRIVLPYGEIEYEDSEEEKHGQYCDRVFPDECRSCGAPLSECRCDIENEY